MKSAPAQWISRRRMLQAITGGVSLALPGWVLAANNLWLPGEDLKITPTQAEGPFYPELEIHQQLFNDTDLVQKTEGHQWAQGQRLTLSGSVKTMKGSPVAGGVVEIWQACASGRYQHSRDKNVQALLDNNFQFWGRAITGAEGEYSFHTVIPGLYPGRRGRHIHFRVDGPGVKRLSSQCYFGEYGEDNAQDDLYQRLSVEERKLVTVELEKPAESQLPWVGRFDIVLATAD
jgi:protocatechuate 3,4-dioxygenase beta subunit